MDKVQCWQGRFFEDFTVGEIYRHPFGRTISEADNTWFTLLTMNTNQLHFNAHYASRSPFGKVIVNSGLTVALLLGQSVFDVSQNAMANLEMTNVRLIHPVFVGDTLYAESICTALRASESLPYAGIVSVHSRSINQDGEECLSLDRSVMVYRREAPQGRGYFPEAKTGPLTLVGEV